MSYLQNLAQCPIQLKYAMFAESTRYLIQVKTVKIVLTRSEGGSDLEIHLWKLQLNAM